MGRRLAAATTTVLTGLLIWYSARVIYRDSFATPPPDPRDTSCAVGIRRLHVAYRERWESHPGADSPDLDQAGMGLRPVCEREGAGAAEAFAHFERWRYRAEDHAAIGRALLDDDARIALAYQSPGASR